MEVVESMPRSSDSVSHAACVWVYSSEYTRATAKAKACRERK